jgi:D-sedoheptulose 7-phosphate isomerase
MQVQKIVNEHLSIVSKLNNEIIVFEIEKVVNEITKSLSKGNRIYLCGNGGSAADAQHLAAEFTGRFFLERSSLPAEALHCNTSYLTAVGNDYGFDKVYSRIIDGIAREGDLLIGLSTSGNSENILNAFKSANSKKIKTVLFSGQSGGKIIDFSDYKFLIPSESTPRIQECHILIGHIICELVEKNIFHEKI